MFFRGLIAAVAAAATVVVANAQPADPAKYPPFAGQWIRHTSAQWDPSKPRGLGQQAPLTSEYQAILEANVAALKAGREAFNPQARCLPGGMPRMMIAYEPMEVIVTPNITYIWIEQMGEFRRIYTDGRDWPANPKPAFKGYSIGKWEGADKDGRYDTLVVETRHMRGPRTFDAEGVPLHKDNQTVIKERIYLDQANPNLLYDEVTTVDNALTRPWTVTRRYRREPKPLWPENLCAENNQHVQIGTDSYLISSDGHLMPMRKDQPPPDLKNFTAAPK